MICLEEWEVWKIWGVWEEAWEALLCLVGKAKEEGRANLALIVINSNKEIVHSFMIQVKAKVHQLDKVGNPIHNHNNLTHKAKFLKLRIMTA